MIIRSPREGNGRPLQDSCLENTVNRGAWQDTVHGVTRVGNDLTTKPPNLNNLCCFFYSCFYFPHVLPLHGLTEYYL